MAIEFKFINLLLVLNFDFDFIIMVVMVIMVTMVLSDHLALKVINHSMNHDYLDSFYLTLILIIVVSHYLNHNSIHQHVKAIRLIDSFLFLARFAFFLLNDKILAKELLEKSKEIQSLSLHINLLYLIMNQ